MSHAIVLAIANHKGGVGKTSTAINLACALAGLRHQVLLIDLDPQGSASASFIQNRSYSIINIGDALINGTSFAPCIRSYRLGKFDFIPSSDDLTSFCVVKQNTEDKEQCLDKRLEPLRSIYDFIIIDCPPALNLLTINALCAADEFIVPTTCEFFAVEGLSSILRLFERLKQEGKSHVHLLGIVRTMFEQDQSLSSNISKRLKDNFENLLFQTIIPFTPRISEAPSLGRPVLLYDKSSIGAKAYFYLASEILKRLKSVSDTATKSEEARESKETKAQASEATKATKA